MNEEELKLLNKLDDLPNKLNLEIRGLILAEVMLRKENQELKKQLNEKIVLEMKLKEELEDKRKEYQETYKDVREEIKDYKNQQKEFIIFLNNMIIAYKRAEKEYGNVADRAFWIAFEAALSKYKEIIGGDNK